MGKTKAIVLAGGFGTRLKPLTINKPKPLCDILGESVIGHLIGKIKAWGIDEAAISTMYLSEKITESLGNEYCGVKLYYVKEESPLGSAGGAKLAYNALKASADDNILVLSGDGIFDFNLEKAINFHKNKNCDVTIISHLCDSPLEYGVLECEKDGKVRTLREKPSWEMVTSDRVNTGIYILNADIFSEIPEGHSFDFSKDLFPHLLGSGRKIYSFSYDGYWCDIGDIASYYRCCIDALNGKIEGVSPSFAMSKKEIEEKGLNVTFPCYISKGAKISKGAIIGKNSIIHDGCEIYSGAEISGSILMKGVTVEKGSEITGSIICENCRIGKDSKILKGSIIGDSCNIKDQVIVSDGVCVWPGKVIEKGFCVAQDVLFENKCNSLYSDDGFFVCHIGESINCEYVTRLGKAFVKAVSDFYKKTPIPVRIGVMHDFAPESALICETLLCGIKSCGGKGYSFLCGFEAQGRYVASSFMTDILLFVTKGGDDRIIKVFDKYSLPVSREFERTLEGAYRNPTIKEACGVFDTRYCDNSALFYYSELIRALEDEFSNDNTTLLSGIKCRFSSEINKGSAGDILKNVIIDLGGEICYADDCIMIDIDDDGLSAIMSDASVSFDTYHIIACLMSYGKLSGDSIPNMPHFVPLAFGEVLQNSGFTSHAFLEKTRSTEQSKRMYIAEGRKYYDMCYAISRLLCIMNMENETLSSLSNSLPEFEIKVHSISTEEAKGEKRATVMKQLYEKYSDVNENSRSDGMRLIFDEGNVTVIPRRAGGFRIISEAKNAEFAEDLCIRIFDEIKKIEKKI